MKTVIRAFPPGVNMRKEGNASRNSVKWGPAENRKRRGSKRHRIATGIGAQPHEPRTPMDGRTLSHLPGTADPQAVIRFTVSHIGGRYDLKNVFDLARYLIPTPPVPVRWRRRMIAFGSGDPTRAICSTLVAQAFQSVHYPILPEVKYVHDGTPGCNDCYHEVMHIRHHSLFTPRDFDISPYFEVVKPTIAKDFDYHKIAWAQEDPV